jgi:uncharacterized phage protein (TIGR02220 family)
MQHFDGRQRELKSRLAFFEKQTCKKYKAGSQKVQESNTDNNTKNNKEIYIAVCDCLNRYAKTNYKASSSATQRLINARVAEGFTVEDFETVIKKKCAEWKGSEMEKYLRPETLFGTKFENYLNAKQTTAETPKATSNFELTGGLNL